jgi:hypothetical protein
LILSNSGYWYCNGLGFNSGFSALTAAVVAVDLSAFAAEAVAAVCTVESLFAAGSEQPVLASANNNAAAIGVRENMGLSFGV